MRIRNTVLGKKEGWFITGRLSILW